MSDQESQTHASTAGSSSTKPLLEVNALKKYFPIQRGFLKRVVGHVKAVDDVNFYVNEGRDAGIGGRKRLRENHHGQLYSARSRPHQREICIRTRIWGGRYRQAR